REIASRARDVQKQQSVTLSKAGGYSELGEPGGKAAVGNLREKLAAAAQSASAHVDRPAEAAAAVFGACRTAKDLEALDNGRRNEREVRISTRAVERDAIEKEQHPVRRRSPDAEQLRLAEAALVEHHHPRGRRQ